MRPAIVFLHGFTHTGRSWDPVIAELGQRYRALAPDIRGHGGAAERRPVNLAACVDDVLGEVDGGFALVGYSMGARLALRVALCAPGRVRRLVLIGGTAGIADGVERVDRRRRDEALAERVEAGTIEEFVRSWEQQPVLRGQPSAVARAARRDRLRNQPAGLAAALRGLGTGAMDPLWSSLGALPMPVTVIVGERDGKFRKLGERMVAELPDAELVVVQAAGHAVHLEAPALVAACLRERVSATGSA